MNDPTHLQMFMFDNPTHLRATDFLEKRLVQVIAFVKNTGLSYRWDPKNTEADDFESVLKPDSVDAGSPGRWVLAFGGVSGGGGGGTPDPHATSHEDGGSDEIDVTGLSGVLADAQTPAAHTHDSLDPLVEDIDMDGNKVVNLGAGTDGTDAVNLQQMEEYVAAAIPVGLEFWLWSTASAIEATYRQMKQEVQESSVSYATASITSTDPATPTEVEQWIAETSPGLDRIPAGAFEMHLQAKNTTGNANVYFRCLVYKRAVGGAETLLATSGWSSAVSTVDWLAQDIHAIIASEADLDVTDTLVVKVQAYRAAGANQTLSIRIGTTTTAHSSHFAIPVDSVILEGFLRKSGGTMTGQLVTKASTTGSAPLNIPEGTAPTSPNDGDHWLTATGAFVRVNGHTYQYGG